MAEDQDKLLGEAKKQVDRNAFEMKSSLVSADAANYHSNWACGYSLAVAVSKCGQCVWLTPYK